MDSKRAARLAWTLCGLTTCLAIVLFGVGLLGDDGAKDVFQTVGDALFALVIPIVFVTVAALIVSRQPRNIVGWLLMIPTGAFLVLGPVETYIERIAPASPAPTPTLLLMVWLSSWSWLLFIFPVLVLVLLFPNGRPPTRSWRWVGRALISWPVLLVILATLTPTIQSETTPQLVLDNPVGILSEGTDEWLAGMWFAGMMVLVVLCVGSLFVRYRRASYTEREQIKWLLYACAVFLVVFMVGALTGFGVGSRAVDHLWGMFFVLCLAAFPVAIGVAILRYRLYEIDVIIRRTLVYGVLTGTLALLYFSAVAMLQFVSRALTDGGAQQPQWAIVASTLAIAALFQPLRRRMQRFIDHRFYRRKYDAARILAAFGATLRDEVDLDTLSQDLLAVVHETVQPEHASLWLKPPEARR
jgi:hypothetical protein